MQIKGQEQKLKKNETVKALVLRQVKHNKVNREVCKQTTHARQSEW